MVILSTKGAVLRSGQHGVVLHAPLDTCTVHCTLGIHIAFDSVYNFCKYIYRYYHKSVLQACSAFALIYIILNSFIILINFRWNLNCAHVVHRISSYHAELCEKQVVFKKIIDKFSDDGAKNYFHPSIFISGSVTYYLGSG